MATRRKATPSRSKATKPKKKKAAGASAAKTPARAARAPRAGTTKPKAAARKPEPKAAKLAKVAKPAPAAAAPLKAAKGAARPKVVPAKRPVPAVVRPIGALPAEAVARAVRSAPQIAPRPSKPAPRPQRETAPRESPEGVSEKDFKEFELRLLAERQKILKEMGHLETTVLKVNQRESAGDLSGYSFHMADVGTDAMEREKAFLFASNEGHLLREIDDALRKIYSGSYGACEHCEQPIGRARLEAMPYARLCLACKEAEERSARGQT